MRLQRQKHVRTKVPIYHRPPALISLRASFTVLLRCATGIQAFVYPPSNVSFEVFFFCRMDSFFSFFLWHLGCWMRGFRRAFRDFLEIVNYRPEAELLSFPSPSLASSIELSRKIRDRFQGLHTKCEICRI